MKMDVRLRLEGENESAIGGTEPKGCSLRKNCVSYTGIEQLFGLNDKNNSLNFSYIALCYF